MVSHTDAKAPARAASLEPKAEGFGWPSEGSAATGAAARKVRHQRQDFLHKLSSRLVRDYDLITIEDLNVGGLARTKLSTSVLDASWGRLHSLLTYKADRNNATFMLVDRFFGSTRLCSECGVLKPDLTLADRQWICQCGVRHDRDLNAARNIDHESLRLYHLNVAAGLAETQNAGGDWVGPLETGGAGR